MAIDRRNLQVLANYCSAAADAMAYTLMRTAHSTFVKETEDFSCAIVTDTGLCFANPRSYGAPWYSGIDYGPVLRMIDDYEEGDICITNDSYSGNVATHSPDLHIWKPVFHEGKLACFVVGHIHKHRRRRRGAGLAVAHAHGDCARRLARAAAEDRPGRRAQ